MLWLATSMVQHANSARADHSDVKVGGHQASSASIVSIMTALYFCYLQAADRVSVKPHASPVLHAIEYLLGWLDRDYLTRLRSFGGLQSYPSRVKDPIPADFSTGSVGIGATAPIWSALAHRYISGHFDVPRGGRQISLVGDAELDEGAVWEALVDPLVREPRRGALDHRRQPAVARPRRAGHGRRAADADVRGGRLADDSVKYGHRVEEVFARPGGEELRVRIDEMTNEEYQHLLRMPPPALRDELPPAGRASRASSGSSTTASFPPPSATSEATISEACSTRLPRSTAPRTGRRSSSPTRSRRGACPPRDIPATIRRCSRPSSGSSSAPASAPSPTIRGRRSTRRARPQSSAARHPTDCAASRSSRSPRRPFRPTSGASTPGGPRPSRLSAASSSISRTRPRTSPTAW